MRDQSFQMHGPKLFNSLPAKLRNKTKCSIDDFKTELDQYLEKIPDEPKIDGMNPNALDNRGRYSNSILHQVRRSHPGLGPIWPVHMDRSPGT